MLNGPSLSLNLGITSLRILMLSGPLSSLSLGITSFKDFDVKWTFIEFESWYNQFQGF